MSTTTEQNKAVIWRFIDAWNSRQPDAFDDLIAPDVVRHCEAIPGVEARNLDQVKELLRQDTMVFPDSVPSGRKAQFDFRAVFRMNTVFVAVRFSAQPSNPAVFQVPPSLHSLDLASHSFAPGDHLTEVLYKPGRRGLRQEFPVTVRCCAIVVGRLLL